MIRRELWIPLAVVGLGAAFALVSWLVRLSRGNPWLIRRKLRLGSLLLTLTWAAEGCNEVTSTCYVPALPDDRVVFDDRFAGESGLVLDLAAGSELSGEILSRTSGAYAFQLVAADEAEIQRGDLAAADGAFDEAFEAFRLSLDPAGLPAAGVLRLYRGPADAIEPASLIHTASLTVLPAR